MLLGTAAGLGAALSASAGFRIVKVMGVHVHFEPNTLVVGLAGVILSAFMTSRADVWDTLQNGYALTLMTLYGVLGFASPCFINWGMQICRPGPALIVKSFSVPVTFLLG